MATVQYVVEVKGKLLLELPDEAERLHLRPGDKLSIYIDHLDSDADAEPEVNEGMIATLREIAERQKGRRYTDGSNSVSMLREARSGAMWGYDPVED